MRLFSYNYFILLIFPPGAEKGEHTMKKIKVVTFNIRNCWNGDGQNDFRSRLGGILDKINGEKPDVICFQEATESNMRLMKSSLCDYAFYFNPREADLGGEGVATALKKDAFDLLSLDFFWLSDTPDIPGSRYENQSDCPRICQCLLVKHRGELVRIYNTHLDHMSQSACEKGIRLVLDRISADREKLDCPFFIFGDFNSRPDSKTLKICRECQNPKVVDLTENSGMTFHGYKIPTAEDEKNPGLKIDYILTDEKTAKRPFTLTKWTEERHGVFLSDHYPVCVEFHDISENSI